MNMNKKNILMILLLVGWGVCAMAQVHLFVASDGDDSSNGLNWENAKQTVQGAIAIANNNSIIHVKVGIYNLAAEFTVPNGVTVIGGYATASEGTDITQRNYPGTNSNWTNASKVTILDGGYTHRVATVSAGGRLEGCIIKHGKTTGNGAGVLIDGGTVTHCVMLNNMAYNNLDTTQAKGGGAYIQNNGQLLNCVVSYNRADNGFGVAGTTGDVVNNTITQNSGTHCGTLVDYDGHLYETVVIGEQCWMRENLRTTHYADGTPIPTSGYYNPGSSEAETHIFGMLYTWGTARNNVTSSYSNPSGVQGVCPDGWHLPSNAEFFQMSDFLACDDDNCCSGNTTYVAKALASNEHWQTSTSECAIGNDLSANNRSLFNAQPAGFYYSNTFNSLYSECYFWAASGDTDGNRGDLRRLGHNSANFEGDNYGYWNTRREASNRYSVRCVKD